MSEQATTRRVFARRVESSDPAPAITDLTETIKSRWEKFRLARIGYLRAREQVKKLKKDEMSEVEITSARLERDYFGKAMEAARITRELHLAHCYLKGRTYKQCEQKCNVGPDAWKIARHLWGEGTRTLVASKDGETHIVKWLTTENANRFDLELYWTELKAVEEAAKKLKDAEKSIEVYQQREQDAYRLAAAAQASIQENQTKTREAQQSISALKESLASAEGALKNKKEQAFNA